mmetsp:Transcript_10775/g.21430  ORF Transcript_10775/g.21430 Transcript_10775/m.21430 type:complete len:133 (+) Transcript_10775:87-485(+)
MAVCLLQISPIFHEDERHTDSARQLDCCLLVASSTSHRAPSKKGLDNCGFSGGDSTPIDILCGVFFLVCMFSFMFYHTQSSPLISINSLSYWQVTLPFTIPSIAFSVSYMNFLCFSRRPAQAGGDELSLPPY